MEEDGPLNFLYASKGLLHMLTSREPPFEEALDWLQFTYTADQVGAYVAPASTLIDQSAIAEGANYFLQYYRTS